MDAELFELLRALSDAGYVIESNLVDRMGRPEAVAAVLHRGRWADVVILHGITRAYAYRTPRGAGWDVLEPEEVSWDITGKPVRALRALLELPAPDAKGAPTELYPAQTGLCLPAELRAEPRRTRRREPT